MISRPIDFLGVNYYIPTRVRESADVAAAGRDRRRRAGADDRDGLGGRRRAGCTTCCCGCGADYGDLEIWITENGAAFDDEHAGRRRGRGPVAGRVLCRPPRTRCGARSPTASTSAATTRGRCSTTSSGSTATTSASGSCAWTTPRRSACPSAARSGTATTSRGARRRLMASIAFEDVSKVFPDGTTRRRRAGPRDRRRRVHDPGRAVGLRQVDRAADGRRAGGRVVGRDHDRRRAWSTTSRPRTATSRWSSSPTRCIRT